MKKQRLTRWLSIAIALVTVFSLCTISVAAETTAKRALTDYNFTREVYGWWGESSKIDSVWIKLGYTGYGGGSKTSGYYEGWSTNNQITTGTYHPKGIGMHSAQSAAPSIIYDVDKLKVTSLKTSVFLVQYDRGTTAELWDVDTVTPGSTYGPSTVKIYFAVAKEDNDESYTVIKEMDLTGKGSHVDVELTAADLKDQNFLKFGISTLHTDSDQDPGASVYFADLEITQSEQVAVTYIPSVPMRPTTAPKQLDAYQEVELPMMTDTNPDGKPYGTWKAGQNTLYYLSDLIPDGIPDMNGDVVLPENSKYLASSNTTNKAWTEGQPTTKDYPYSERVGTPFVFGAPEYEYTKGIGMHPKNPKDPYKGRTDSWTLFDVSDFTKEGSTTPADTFYALVGLTAGTNEWGSKLTCQGLYVYVYGDKVGDGEHFEFLAASGEIISYQLGEFNVNISGVKLLLLQVILVENATSHGYSGVGFGDACLFMADPNATKPDYSVEETSEDNKTTEAPVTTKTPATTENDTPATTAPATTEPAKEQTGGCGSVINGAAVLLVGLLAGGVCLCKRRKEE